MTKSIVQEAKDAVKANKPKTTPWYVKLAVWALDSLSAIAVLALAILGARELVQTSLADEAKVGIAVLIVGLLAARLIERIFQARR